MASNGDDELVPEQTEGFKLGDKKTIDEYQQLGRRCISDLTAVVEDAMGGIVPVNARLWKKHINAPSWP